jgi:peptide chain release factor 1
MIDWVAVQKEVDSLSERLSSPSLAHADRAAVQKRYTQLSRLLELNGEISQINAKVEEYTALLADSDDEMSQLYQEEVDLLTQERERLDNELDDKLYPADERDDRSVFLEIRAGAGGQEAALFAADLFRAYSNYSLRKGWVVSIVESGETDIGGLRELVAHIKGRGVFRELKHESGVHRVQRVPATEGAGRIHTSTVTVAVLSEAEEVDVNIQPQDLRVDVYRSSGAGGQHVNTTDSAVRITHIPTGIVVTCQDERSQIKNRAKAMKVLQARLYDAEQEKLDEERRDARRQQVGTGGRSEKIRTYNYPQNRVSDHRINLTLKKLDLVMEGDLEDVITPLIENERRERKSQVRIV